MEQIQKTSAGRGDRGLFARHRWNPYVVGAMIGVLSWVTFWGMGKALGVSTTMVRASGALAGAVVPGHVQSNAYYGKYFNPPKKTMFDWQFALVIGLVGGALIGSRLIGKGPREVERVPALWSARFGPSRAKRYTAAFIGGAVLLYGARLAGGCTSGHGISGGLQLAVSSWVFFIAMFAAGVATAFALFGMKGRDHVEL
jgi:uncharacterized protein